MTISDDEQQPSRAADQPSSLEWAVAVLGLALVLGTIGFMLYRAFAEEGTPPVIAIEVDTVRPAGDRFLVTFVATNRGDEAAADLVVEGESRGAGGDVEISTATLRYVPGGSEREGGLYFTSDPRTRTIILRPKGYERP